MKTRPEAWALVAFAGILVAATSTALPGTALAGTVSYSLTAPTTGANDIFNFTGATMDRNNVLGDGVNDGGANDAGTYVAHDRAHLGQTFTTGATAGVVQAVWLRHVGYTGNSPASLPGGTYHAVPAGADFRARITNPSAAGTAGFVLLDDLFVTTGTEPDTIPTGFMNTFDGTGTWVRFGFGSPLSLTPNTVYGFDVTSLAGGPNVFFETLGINTDVYAGGAAYNGSTNGTPDNSLNELIGDRVFVVELASPGAGLSLFVNKNDGATKIRNNTAAAITFDYYEVESADPDGPGGTPGGALNPANFPTGWNSLSDQNIDAGVQADFNNSGTVNNADLGIIKANFATGTTKAQGDADSNGRVDGNDFLVWQRQVGKTPGEGDSWDEAGGSNNVKLAEAFLNGATTLLPGAELSLGKAFNPAVFGVGVDGNLSFRYSGPGQGSMSVGNVQYVTSGPITAVPEPATIVGALAAALGLLGKARRWAASPSVLV